MMSEPKRIDEIIHEMLREQIVYVSPLVKESPEEYLRLYSDFAEVSDAYFAPSSTQLHEDLHLWFKTRGAEYEFFLNNIVEMYSFFKNTMAIVAEDIKDMELYVEVSKYKSTSHKIISRVILEKPQFGKPDTRYLLDYE
jgi:hypothetical protein